MSRKMLAQDRVQAEFRKRQEMMEQQFYTDLQKEVSVMDMLYQRAVIQFKMSLPIFKIGNRILKRKNAKYAKQNAQRQDNAK